MKPVCCGSRMLHESDDISTRILTTEQGFQHRITRCKYCGCEMSRPLKSGETKPATDPAVEAAAEVFCYTLVAQTHGSPSEEIKLGISHIITAAYSPILAVHEAEKATCGDLLARAESMAQSLEELSEYWANNTPVSSGSLVANDAQKALTEWRKIFPQNLDAGAWSLYIAENCPQETGPNS